MSEMNRDLALVPSDPKLPFEGQHADALQRMRMLRGYYKWSLGLFRSYLGRRVLDAGCGVGNLTALLEPIVDFVLAVDLSEQNLAIAKERFAESKKIECRRVDLEEDGASLVDRKIDTVLCLDVLEHLEDDLAMLESFRHIVRPGGHLLIKVPACPWLFGSIDVASGHYRRYRPVDLRDRAESAGWKALKVGYMNLAGVLPYWLKSRVLKRSANFSRTFSPMQLAAIRAVMPGLRVLDRVTGPPVGQSAYLVAQRVDEA